MTALLDGPAAAAPPVAGLERPPTGTPGHPPPSAPAPAPTDRQAARRLRTDMAAVKVSFTWMGVRKALSPQQKAQAAQTFGAEGEFLSAGKKLIDTAHPRFRAVTAVRTGILSYVRGVSLPYPEPGLRLIRRDRLDAFHAQMTGFAAELAEAVEALDRRYFELRQAARLRLGGLFNEADYPAAMTGLFEVAWEFPSLEPPAWLRQLSPERFEEERRRAAARFEEAARAGVQAFRQEFAGLLEHLAERLAGGADGKPKVFRDSAVGNLTEFFARFRDLNVLGDAELDRLVEQAQAAVRGAAPQALRDDAAMRAKVTAELSSVRGALAGLLTDRPRRNILRAAKPAAAGGA